MKTKYSKELLQGIISKSFSYSDVIKELGLGYNGGNNQHIKKIVKFYGIDISHFKGQGWNKGNISHRRKKPEEYLKLYDKGGFPPHKYNKKVDATRRSKEA